MNDASARRSEKNGEREREEGEGEGEGATRGRSEEKTLGSDYGGKSSIGN